MMHVNLLLTFSCLVLVLSYLSTVGAQPAGYACDPAACTLPSCRCASTQAPISNPPQFLLLSYDDSIQSAVWNAAMAPLANRRNPNGCPVTATWFAQVLYSDPSLTTRWYAAGNEVADHSVTHGEFSGNIFAGSYAEVEGMRAWANRYAGIPLNKIRGIRFPFRNYTVEALNMIAKMGFEYDSSMSAQSSDRFWPYTLDNGAANQCYDDATIKAFGSSIITACNTKLNAPGVWEIPLYGFSSPTMQHLMDPFNDPTVSSPVSLNVIQSSMQSAFDSTYNGNRVPFGIYLHPTWMSSAVPTSPNATAKLQTIQNVINYAMSRSDVWMVTYSQLLEYMKNPVSAAELGSQPYMQCNRSPAPPTNVCNGLSDSGFESCPFASGAFSSCYGCPEIAPSLANPAPKSSSSRCPVPTTCDPLFWDPVGCRCTCSSSACAFTDTGRPVNLDPASLEKPSNNGTNNTTVPGGNNGTNSTSGVSKQGPSPSKALMGSVLLATFILSSLYVII